MITRPLYYIPGVTGMLSQDAMIGVMEERGLSAALGGFESVASTIVRTGPDETGGIVLSITPQNQEQGDMPVYLPASQSWRSCNRGLYWIGIPREPGIVPDALLRGETVDGYYCRLGDGHRWLVPECRAFDGADNLPDVAAWGPDGKLVREAMPKYKRLSARIASIARQIYDENSVDVTDETIELAVDILGINYHVSKYEVGALQLFSPVVPIVKNILLFSVGYPAYVKRKQELGNAETPAVSAGDNTSGG